VVLFEPFPVRPKRGIYGPSLQFLFPVNPRFLLFGEPMTKGPDDRGRVPAETVRTLPIVLKELSGVRERPMIITMPTTARPQQRYDHRASASGPTHWGRDRRHGSRSPSFDGAWVAWRDANARGLSGCCGAH